MKRFEWMEVLNSPFKRLKLQFYIGKIEIGTPYFFPRKWINNKEKPGYMKAIPKKIGFDFVALGWKYKYDSLRFEWAPIWSFVFFKWQIAIIFKAPHEDHYWECWLYYHLKTDKTKSKKERIEEAKELYNCIWTIHNDTNKETICYWDKILKT